jgi:predicted RNase H-like HicB family nuclease
MKTRFTVLIEKGQTDYGAYVPDLPGCIAVGKTSAEVRRLIREAILVHLETMAADGDSLPNATTRAVEIGVETDAFQQVRPRRSSLKG